MGCGVGGWGGVYAVLGEVDAAAALPVFDGVAVHYFGSCVYGSTVPVAGLGRGWGGTLMFDGWGLGSGVVVEGELDAVLEGFVDRAVTFDEGGVGCVGDFCGDDSSHG